MELALVDGVDKLTSILQLCSINCLVELPMVSGDDYSVELDDHCNLLGSELNALFYFNYLML